MVVLSNELRNLLTEDSLNSIMGAGSGPNGHLVPNNPDVINTSINQDILQESPQEKEVISEKVNADSGEIKSFVKEKIDCYDERMKVMTDKMNEMIKTINLLESKLKSLESRPSTSTTEQKVLVKEEKKENKNPRSVDALPPELSMENIFNCNGKKFD
jgi:hypothetical protein